MSDARLHAAAIEALLDAAVTCYVGESPNDASPPHVLLFPDQGRGSRTSIAGGTGAYSHTFQTTSVGTTVEQAQWVADKVRGAVEDVAPTVSGWSTTRIVQQMSQAVRRDDDTDPALFYAVDVWQYQAIPA